MMKPPAASPGRAEKPQLAAPAPPGLARLLLSKSRRGGRSRRAPATSPMFVSARGGGGRSRASSGGGADGEPSSPKVTCIGQVRMRNKGKKKKKKKVVKANAAGPAKAEKASTSKKGYCRCLKKAFLCGGLFQFDRRKRSKQAPPPPTEVEVEQRSTRRSPWVFSSRDVAVAAAPRKMADSRSAMGEEDDDDDMIEVGVGGFGSVGKREEINGGEVKDEMEEEAEPELVSSATTTPPKNALLLMRCRSAPQNRTSPLTARFLPADAAPSPSTPTRAEDAPAPAEFLSPSPRKPEKQASPAPSPSPRNKAENRFSPAPSPSPRRNSGKLQLLDEDDSEQSQGAPFATVQDNQAQEGVTQDDYDDEEDEEMRCSSARPLVLQRCKSEPATTAAAKMTAGPAADATTAGCFWAHGGSSGRRRHAPPPPPAAAPVLALTGH